MTNMADTPAIQEAQIYALIREIIEAAELVPESMHGFLGLRRATNGDFLDATEVIRRLMVALIEGALEAGDPYAIQRAGLRLSNLEIRKSAVADFVAFPEIDFHRLTD